MKNLSIVEAGNRWSQICNEILDYSIKNDVHCKTAYETLISEIERKEIYEFFVENNLDNELLGIIKK